MLKIRQVLLSLLLVVASVANAQSKEVSGQVTSASDGEAIPGVTIRIQGSSNGTITDIEGNYSIATENENAVLEFSFIGMESQLVPVSGKSIISVVLASGAISMDEVVITALGISREKKSLGYASQGVDSEELLAANNPNLMSSLSGKVAGLTVSGQNFAGSQNILIRGASSFTGNNQPLYVVDGIPLSSENFNTTEAQRGGGGYDFGSMASDLNSYDIENIEVLKGSAASALYGSRGQNGVIMITTKSGKQGKKSFSIEINSGVSFEQVSILPELQTQYGGGFGFNDVTVDGQPYKAVQYGDDMSWGPKYEGQDVLHWWGIEDYQQGVTSSPVTAPWVTPKSDVIDFYETGVSYQNSVNIVTTAENSALRIGYTNVNMTGTVPNSKQDKHNLNMNGSASFFEDFIEVNTNINFVKTQTNGRPQFGYGDNSQSQKFFQWGQRQLDFDKLANYKNADGSMRTWNRTSLTDGTAAYSDNPYWTAYENYQNDDRTRIFGTTGLKVNITDYLSATGNIYLDTYTFNQRERVSIGSQALSSYSQATRQFTETNYEGKLNFNKSFNDFNVMAMAGGNIRKEVYSRITGETAGGLVIPKIYNLSNSTDQPTVTNFDREQQLNSIFASASVGWKNMLYLDLSIRNDWDSSLPEDLNSYSYPSASASFIASELMEFDWLNMLKLRTNYGETGNGTTPYQVVDIYGVGTPFNGAPQYFNYVSLKNSSLKPERTSEIEFGVEADFFHSRLGLDLSWYDRNTENQIVPVEVSGATGYTERVINAGKINNKGIEVLLFGTPVKTKDFAWNVSLNYAKNKNTVLDLPDGLDKIQIGSAPFGGAYLNATEGATFQELYVTNYEYDNDGNRLIDPNTGFYSTSDVLESVGSVLPDYTAGLSNQFSYKNFDLGILIDMSKGGHYYSITNMWGMYSGMMEGTTVATSGGNTIREDGLVLDGVIANADGSFTQNDINLDAESYGGYFYHGNGTPSATSVFDATYFKLREVTLGYNLPKFSNIIKSAKISVYGRNLAVWGLDNPGIDPETIVGGSGNVQGLEGGIVPATRSYGFNLNIKF